MGDKEFETMIVINHIELVLDEENKKRAKPWIDKLRGLLLKEGIDDLREV